VQFTPGEPDLRAYRSRLALTEIHYHPAPPTQTEAAAGFEEADFEFLELHNRGPGIVDLGALLLTGAVNFDFAGSAITELEAGSVLVVARNAEAFRFRYGDDVPLAGEWGAQRLDNAGELLHVSYGPDSLVFEIAYDDASPWPEEADGGGPSLESRFPGVQGLELEGAHWQASVEQGGTPGRLPGLRWEEWLGTHFSAAELQDPELAGPAADPDADGSTNLVEFALDSDPRAGGQVGLRVLRTGENWELSVPLREGIRGAAVAIEVSSDLKVWQSADIAPAVVFENGGRWELRWTIPARDEADGSPFYRMAVRR
jgi:hypothetical protein